MLLNLHKKKWTDGLTLRQFDSHSKTNEQTVQEMLNLAIKYNKAVQEEDELPPEKLAIANVGRQDAKKHLEEHVSNLMSSNIVQTLGTMLDTVVLRPLVLMLLRRTILNFFVCSEIDLNLVLRLMPYWILCYSVSLAYVVFRKTIRCIVYGFQCFITFVV
ncbi:hypothetical protein Dsin_003321 [Dipteronia sinensis]|uniref:26S proteasome regulatory subunit RPN11 C-terminal domain-containing protein n=1 Tax=Dipteronia sinensis TaxID=43782 RepID=A0AAE0B8X9_9ROSI|nr:hypothetical protein Dsin_003321 [Dipteronia sinensis]